MKLNVIIPFIHRDYINELLSCIEKNSVQPDKIYLLNNAANNIPIMTKLSQCEHIQTCLPTGIPLSLNASWNYGISRCADDCDLISILNDDLLLEPLFFEKIIQEATATPWAGVFCPQTVTDKENLYNPWAKRACFCVPMKRREGWAWTIRSELAKKIPAIPDELQTWCGDDWYWQQCYKAGFVWVKIMNNFCFHYIGGTVRKTNARDYKEKEKHLFKEMIVN